MRLEPFQIFLLSLNSWDYYIKVFFVLILYFEVYGMDLFMRLTPLHLTELGA